MRLTVTSLLGERKPDDLVRSRGSGAVPPAYPCEKPRCATQLDAPEESYLARRKAARRELQQLAEKRLTRVPLIDPLQSFERAPRSGRQGANTSRVGK